MQLALGVDCGGTRIRCGFVNRAGEMIGALHQVEARGEKTRDLYLRAITATISNALRDADQVAGIGIGMKGLVDYARGISIYPPGIEGWRDVPLADLVQRETGLPTWIENDVRVAAIGEQWRGAAHDESDFVFVILGTGIGTAIFRDGRLVRGVSSSAGEWGHTLVEFGNQDFKCACGQFGHWEALAAGGSLEQRARLAMASGRTSNLFARAPITGKLIADAARQGDASAIEILRATGKYIGIGLENIINAENPALIVLGGGMIESADGWFATAEQTARAYAMELPATRARIITSMLDANRAGVIGAARLVWNALAI